MSMWQTAGEVMQAARDRLRSVSDTPGMDVQLLLAHVSGRSREDLLTHPEIPLTDNDTAEMNTLVSQYLAGTALPHLLGWWEFYGRRFHITRDVLIPRPETEQLVAQALALLPVENPARILDVGTGSGIIAITLLMERLLWKATAVDRYRAALKAAYVNRLKFPVEARLSLIQGDLGNCLSGGFDLVCANLPYIPQGKLRELVVASREPLTALDGGADGLDLIRRLLLDLPRLLRSGGTALLEIEAGQGPAVLGFATQNLDAGLVEIQKDLSGRDRLLVLQGLHGNRSSQ